MEENITDKNNGNLTFPDIELAQQLFGEHNQNLDIISKAVDVSINARGNTLFIEGDSVGAGLARNILNQLYGLLREKYPIFPTDVDHAIRILSKDNNANLKSIFLDTVYITSKKRPITLEAWLKKNTLMQ